MVMTEQLAQVTGSGFEVVRDEAVQRGPRRYHRVLVRTPWVTGPIDLADLLRTALGDRLAEGTAFICEKVAIVATGRTVSADTVKVGRFARAAARYVRPRPDDRALSIPERMQFAIDRIGWPRTLLACAAAALTRPFPLRGAFYAVAGREARDMDGMHPPYERTILPPLPPKVARELATSLAAELGTPVAIIDINDYGGRVRAVSPGALTHDQLFEALNDNPMGHSEARDSTPVGLVSLLRD